MKIAQTFGIALWIGIWIALVAGDARLGIDFVPLYSAAKRILAGQSPYGAAATAELAAHWNAPFAAAGNAYPLPLLMLIIPMTLLPLIIATMLWIGAGSMGTIASVGLAQTPRTMLLLPFLFLPFHRAVVMGQATLVWMALIVALIYAIRSNSGWGVGVLCALLLLKPQNGAILALGGLVWAARVHRPALWWFAGTSLVLAAGAWLIQPGWIGAWLEQVRLYRTVVQPQSVLPAGIVVLLACCRLPWWGILAAAQVVCFPLTDLYSALPLLLCWVSIGGPVALVGAGVSWLWPLLGLSNDLTTVWSLLLLPLMAGALWRGWLASDSLLTQLARPWYRRQSNEGIAP